MKCCNQNCDQGRNCPEHTQFSFDFLENHDFLYAVNFTLLELVVLLITAVFLTFQQL